MSYLELAKKALQAQKQRKAPDIQAHNEMAREELDAFFIQKIVPELTRLHMAGKLPNLAQCPLWAAVEAAWNQASVHSSEPCDVKAVKRAMLQAIEAYQKAGQGGLF